MQWNLIHDLFNTQVFNVTLFIIQIDTLGNYSISKKYMYYISRLLIVYVGLQYIILMQGVKFQ